MTRTIDAATTATNGDETNEDGGIGVLTREVLVTLSKGDQMLFGDRKEPLDVHLFDSTVKNGRVTDLGLWLEGPRGGMYRLQASRGDDSILVEREVTLCEHESMGRVDIDSLEIVDMSGDDVRDDRRAAAEFETGDEVTLSLGDGRELEQVVDRVSIETDKTQIWTGDEDAGFQSPSYVFDVDRETGETQARLIPGRTGGDVIKYEDASLAEFNAELEDDVNRGRGIETDGGQDEVRFKSEVVEHDDGTVEVLPPEVEVRGDVDEALVKAVNAALADAPNAAIEPLLIERDADEFGLARFIANYQELPATGEDGELLGWKAPYQAREKIDAALREHLPAGIAFEAKNNHTTILYSEGGGVDRGRGVETDGGTVPARFEDPTPEDLAAIEKGERIRVYYDSVYSDEPQSVEGRASIAFEHGAVHNFALGDKAISLHPGAGVTVTVRADDGRRCVSENGGDFVVERVDETYYHEAADGGRWWSAYRAVEDMGFFCYSGEDGDLYRKPGLAGWRISLSSLSYRIQKKGETFGNWVTKHRREDVNEERVRREFVDAVRHLVEHGDLDGLDADAEGGDDVDVDRGRGIETDGGLNLGRRRDRSLAAFKESTDPADVEPVTVDELLDAGIDHGDELSISYTISKRHRPDRRHTIEVTALGPVEVETFEDTGHRIAKLAVRKRNANYESYALQVSEFGASVYSGDPEEKHTRTLGSDATIDVSQVAELDDLGRLIRAHLWDNDELLKDEFEGEGEHPLAGHCYVASEAYYHLSGRQEDLTVCRTDVDGVTHWFLEDDSDGADGFVDLTADQFDEPVDYDERTRTGFMTGEPSARAQQVIDALEGVVRFE